MTESDSVLRVCWQQGGDSDVSVSTPKETNMEGSKTEISHNWLPLERAIRSSFWDDFMHMGADGTIQKYKHRDTRRYLYIDSDCERFYRWVGGDGETKYEETSKAGALSRVLPCAGTANLLGLAPTSFRAANLLAAFLTFQGYAWWWGIYKPDEAQELLRVLSSIGSDLADFARIIAGEFNEREGEELFALATTRIRETIGMLRVPAAWSLSPGEDDSLATATVRDWQAFCDRLAAQAGSIPFYGLAAPDKSQESLQRPVEASTEAPQQETGLWRRVRELLGL